LLVVVAVIRSKEFCKLQYQISNIVNSRYRGVDWVAVAGNMCLLFESPLIIQTVKKARWPSRRGSNYRSFKVLQSSVPIFVAKSGKAKGEIIDRAKAG
jgi:hypothetical protein